MSIYVNLFGSLSLISGPPFTSWCTVPRSGGALSSLGTHYQICIPFSFFPQSFVHLLTAWGWRTLATSTGSRGASCSTTGRRWLVLFGSAGIGCRPAAILRGWHVKLHCVLSINQTNSMRFYFIFPYWYCFSKGLKFGGLELAPDLNWRPY